MSERVEADELGYRLLRALMDIFLPSGVLLFLRARNACIDGMTPAEAIEGGHVEQLTTLVHRYEAAADGNFS